VKLPDEVSKIQIIFIHLLISIFILIGNKFFVYYFNQQIMSSSNQVRKYDSGHQKRQKKQKNRRINTA
jgi:hypothetical protein